MTQVSSIAVSPPAREVPPTAELVDVRAALWHLVTSLVYLAIAMLAGFAFSLQFLQHYPFEGIEWLSPGRWRMIHTNGVAYGFLANAFLCGLHWAVPRLTLRPVYSRKLSWFIFWAWQGVVLVTVFGLIAGHAQALEWGETPTYIDP